MKPATFVFLLLASATVFDNFFNRMSASAQPSDTIVNTFSQKTGLPSTTPLNPYYNLPVSGMPTTTIGNVHNFQVMSGMPSTTPFNRYIGYAGRLAGQPLPSVILAAAAGAN